MNSNDSIFKAGIEAYVAKFVEAKVLQIGTDTAHEIIRRIEDGNFVPHQTFNLQDSTGVGVYNNGVLHSYVPRQSAMEPNPSKPNPKWGWEELEKALASGTSKYNEGIWIVLFGGSMPYAAQVNEKWGYHGKLIKLAVRELFENIHQMDLE